MTGFTDLPAELRVQIWQYSLPEPRNLVLSWNGEDFRSNAYAPNLAHVCRESRLELATKYELSFSSQEYPAHIWFDFSCETLYVTDDAYERLPSDVLQRIIRLRHFRNTDSMAQRCSS